MCRLWYGAGEVTRHKNSCWQNVRTRALETHAKCQVGVTVVNNSSLGRPRQGISRSRWLAWVVILKSSWFDWLPDSVNNAGEQWGMILNINFRPPYAHACTHTCIIAHAYLYVLTHKWKYVYTQKNQCCVNDTDHIDLQVVYSETFPSTSDII